MANASACFFPDQTTTGAQTDPQFVPCDPSAPASACCAVGESCLESGYCYSGNGQLYRGACTDKTWNDDACPHECNQSPTNLYSYLTPCSRATTGLAGSLNWVCGDRAFTGVDPCSDPNASLFVLKAGTIAQTAISGNYTTSSTSSAATSMSTSAATATATVTVTASATATAPATHDAASCTNPTVIGAGIGIPLGALLLLAVGSTIWYRRKWKKEVGAAPGGGAGIRHSIGRDGYTGMNDAPHYAAPKYGPVVTQAPVPAQQHPVEMSDGNVILAELENRQGKFR